MKISHIPTDAFNAIIEALVADGWTITEEYDGMDAWIDYGLVVLEKNGTGLRLEWDNWSEGSCEGPEEAVREIREAHGLAEALLNTPGTR